MTWEPYIHQSRNIVAARTMVLQKETISKLECSSEHEEQKEVKKLTWDFFFKIRFKHVWYKKSKYNRNKKNKVQEI
jgi:hypothetical protein